MLEILHPKYSIHHYNKTRLLFQHPLHYMSFTTINSELVKLLKSTFTHFMSEFIVEESFKFQIHCNSSSGLDLSLSLMLIHRYVNLVSFVNHFQSHVTFVVIISNTYYVTEALE